MGGVVPLGYDVMDKCLMENQEEAQRYCQLNVIQTSQPIGSFTPFLSGHDLGARHLLPFTKCPQPKLAIVNRSRQVPTQSEQIAYYAINRKKALSLSS